MIHVPLPLVQALARSFHVTAEARRRYGIEGSIVDLRGRAMVADPRAAERLAARMNEVRDAARFPEAAVSGAEVLAAALLDEAVHLMLDAYRSERDPAWLERLEGRLEGRLGARRLGSARRAFVETFPGADVAAGRVGVDAWLAGASEGEPNRRIVLEERIAVRIANENPALAGLRELVDDAGLGRDDEALAGLLETDLAATTLPVDWAPAATAGEADLWALLRAPMRASPTSLEGQLAWVRERWGTVLGERFAAFASRIVRSLDLLAERRVGAPPGPPGPAPVPDAAALRGPAEEPEAFSADAAWMPRVVMVAKNVHVWMDQLSRRSGREIGRLDEIPDEALAELRGQGMNALWLIGLWQRSEASARIKRLRGQEDAVASAYALDDYRIADDLGGEEAWRALHDRAARHGLRLASDMVPNHVGIDGRWVAERPEWFVGLAEPPYPGYAFTGPDLSGDGRMEVRIEDGYWDGSDAAVVFERRDPATGERRYLYHGNDGTAMPWNDTAQLDYLNPEVREAVIGVILDVARRFPIIRFDAAMTLAKRHVQRLWYPPPGEGGAIPSRAVHGSMPAEEFEARMPSEFWREVVDRVAAEAPDTLLLAEAFWMMEGYFVRTLGMHRVYNSAFMNMLAREANADYQELMRNVLAFEPQILARFVNFMNNPDEETAIAQFGDGDKAFGATTLMATLPGLPMFGHGQVEGLREKYGMEYRRAKLDERPDPHLIDRHRREIAPLLARRAEFAGTERFRLLEVEGETGRIDDVFAYANGRPGGPANLVLYHNRYAEAHGRIRRSAPVLDPATGEPRRADLAEALGLERGDDVFVRFRETPSGLWRLVRAEDLARDGLEVRLGAYERRVWLDVESVRDADGELARLHDALAGRAVPDLEDARRELELAPLHDAFLARIEAPAAGSSRKAGDGVRRIADLADAYLPKIPFDPELATTLLARADAASTEAGRAAAADAADGSSEDEPPGLAWRRAWALAAAFDRPAEAADELRLEAALLRARLPEAEVGPEGWAAAWRATLPDRPPETAPGAAETARETGRRDRGSARPPTSEAADGAGAGNEERAVRRGATTDPSPRDDAAARVDLAALEGDERARRLLGVHEHGGATWFRREGYRAWSAAVLARARILGAGERRVAALADRLREAERASGYRFERLVAGDEAPADGTRRGPRPGGRGPRTGS